jgi:5'-deoxynucleotidase YfbR-like HD superfamily hydrolase
MNLNMRELLNGDIVRLRYVYRYSTSRVSHPETVAEHMYFVALYSLMISKWVQTNTTLRPLINEVLSKAILHDMEEARSGDFPRPFKHSSKRLRTMLDAASREAIEQIIGKLMPVSGKEEHVDNNRLFVEDWANAKNDSLEGRIVEFADFLSVLSFMIEEGCANGRKSIARHVSDMRSYCDNFDEQEYDFIRPLVNQVGELMLETFGS